jgi:hypothetical protein
MKSKVKINEIKASDPTLTERVSSECLTNPDYWQEESDRGERDPCGMGGVAHGIAEGFRGEKQ